MDMAQLRRMLAPIREWQNDKTTRVGLAEIRRRSALMGMCLGWRIGRSRSARAGRSKRMKREQLRKQLDAAWDAFQESYRGLSDEQLTMPGVVGEWSVRDLLVHVMTWEGEALKHLPHIAQGGSVPRYSVTYGGIDAFNALMMEQKRALPLADVLQQAQATHQQLIATIERVPEEQFRADTRWRRRLRLDTYGHYPLHTQAIRAWREERLPPAAALISLPDQVGDAFADDHGGYIGVGADAIGHDRGIGDAQPFEAVDIAILVNDRQWVGGEPHFAGAGTVMAGGDILEHPGIEAGGGAQILVGGRHALGDDFFEGGMLQHCEDDLHALAQAGEVEWVGEIIVVQRGLDMRVAGGERELAGTGGQVDARGEVEADGRRLHGDTGGGG
jgi:hypothetical protein